MVGYSTPAGRSLSKTGGRGQPRDELALDPAERQPSRPPQSGAASYARAPLASSHLPPACPFRESPEHHYQGAYHRQLGNGWYRGCSTGYASWETGSGNETFCGPELQNSGRHTSIAKRFRVSVAPCGSILRVCTLSGSKCIRVTVVDQGPCYDPGAGCWDNLGRDLDLNYRASVWFKGRVGDWDRPVLLRWTVLKRGVNPPWG